MIELEMINRAIKDSRDKHNHNLQETARRWLLSEHCERLCDDIIDYAEMVAYLRLHVWIESAHQLH